CSSCRRIESAAHPDVSWLREESKSRIVSVDQIRDLLQSIHLKPTEAEYKVGIIVGADRLRTEAANAFLKTLEEPPPKSILILLTTEPQRILETIVSRCLRLNFAGSSVRFGEAETSFVSSFSEIAAKEKTGLLARYRLLGALMKNLAQQKEEVEKTLTARSPLERHDDLDPKLRDKWEDELAASIEAEYRRRRSGFLLALEWWLRDVWTQTLHIGGETLTFPQLKNAAQTVAQRISSREAADNLQIFEQTQRLLGSNVQEALALEVGLLKLKL
ncbi:MAG: hypothetical protein ABJC04_13670, partial [Verrucomicrobiota bacterium]